jgi:hypothetical protein
MFVLSNLWSYHDYQGDCRRRLLLTGTLRRIWWPGLLRYQLSYSLAASSCCSTCFPVFHCRNILWPHQLLTGDSFTGCIFLLQCLFPGFFGQLCHLQAMMVIPLHCWLLKLLNFIPHHKCAQVCQCLKASYQMLLPTHCGRFCYISG